MSVCLFVRLRTYLRNNNLHMFDFHQFCGCYTQLYFTTNCDSKKRIQKTELNLSAALARSSCVDVAIRGKKVKVAHTRLPSVGFQS